MAIIIIMSTIPVYIIFVVACIVAVVCLVFFINVCKIYIQKEKMKKQMVMMVNQEKILLMIIEMLLEQKIKNLSLHVMNFSYKMEISMIYIRYNKIITKH